MAVKINKTLLKRWLFTSKKRKKAGFTLLELLISMLIAGVIISVLLSFVIDLVDTDRRENARAETQREMQMALDFIAADLREAVYVYDRIDQPRGSRQALTNYLPDFSGVSQRARPILAFWKAERVPYDNPSPTATIRCDNNSNPECEPLKIRRRAYSLVVYLQAENRQDDPKWKGNSRILRYVLRKFTDRDGDLDSLTQVTGYVDPSSEQTSFESWPLDGRGSSLQTGRPSLADSRPAVLVDYVDKPDNTNANFSITSGRNDDYRCTSTNQNSPFYVANSDTPPYRRVPPVSNGAEQNSNSFFVCVKTLATGDANNQDVFIYLRGNPGERIGRGRTQPLETMRTQAIARGVIDKER